MLFLKKLDGRRIEYVRDLLYELVVRDTKLRYKRSYLGLAWSLINPLLQLLVFKLVFTMILPLKIPDYTTFLFTGILVWTWFSSSLLAATGTIVDNAPMIQHPGFPVAILPVVTASANMVNFLLALPILLVFLISGGHTLNLAILALPLVIAIQFLFTVSLSFLVAACHVPFRDTQYLLSIFLTLGLYLTPVFYDSKSVPVAQQLIYRLNPMVPVLEGYRTILMYGHIPDSNPLILVGLASIGLLILSYRLFVHASYHFAEQI